MPQRVLRNRGCVGGGSAEWQRCVLPCCRRPRAGYIEVAGERVGIKKILSWDMKNTEGFLSK